MQEALFVVEHVHSYETWKGPVRTNPVIHSTYRGGKWCWTCSSWVDPTNEEMAEWFAGQIKKGNWEKKECIDTYCYWADSTFCEAVEAINIAIGDINCNRKSE
jgi:hypothetical protein